MMHITWKDKTFSELTVHEFHEILRLRIDAFVVEQNCVYPELDGADPKAIHFFGIDPLGQAIACARIIPPGPDGLPHIGRVVVRMDHRGKGLATELMQRVLEVVKGRFGSRRSALDAQAHLEHFYARLGFSRIGPDHLLDGIPHVEMRREAE
jgi:ElaA protein